MTTHSFRLFVALLLHALLAPLFSPAVAEEAEPADTQEVSLVTWNIEWFPGRYRFARGERVEDHMAVVQDELREMNPDIFLAQEMRGWQVFADLCAVVPDLQPVIVSGFRSRSTGEYWPQQIAIASKWPVYAAWAEPWQEGEEFTPGRGFSVAAIQLPGDTLRVLLVYSVHLKSNLAESEFQARRNYELRNESIRQLLEHIDEMESAFWDRVEGVIVGGDFNTNHDGQFGDDAIEMMVDAGFHHTWGDTPREERLTWRGSDLYEPTTLDHFFTRGLGEPQAEMVEVSDETSDHWPVRITIPRDQLEPAKE